MWRGQARECRQAGVPRGGGVRARDGREGVMSGVARGGAGRQGGVRRGIPCAPGTSSASGAGGGPPCHVKNAGWRSAGGPPHGGHATKRQVHRCPCGGGADWRPAGRKRRTRRSKNTSASCLTRNSSGRARRASAGGAESVDGGSGEYATTASGKSVFYTCGGSWHRRERRAGTYG